MGSGGEVGKALEFGAHLKLLSRSLVIGDQMGVQREIITGDLDKCCLSHGDYKDVIMLKMI